MNRGVNMHIYLRPITLEDGPNIVKWRNAPSVRAHCLNQKPITIESNEAFFQRPSGRRECKDGRPVL